MKLSLFLFLGLPLLLAGCASSPGSRVAANRAAFESWPADVQDNVLAGKIDVGYTAEQVRMALGAPARVITRKDNDGVSEVWTYGDASPRFSWGFGIGTGGRNSSVGVGVNNSIRGPGSGSTVVFDTSGRVKTIETAARNR